MEYKAVLFDLDGTLINSLADIAHAMNTALISFGLPEWPLEAYRYLVGDGVRKLAERAVRDRQDLRERVQEVYQRCYRAHSEDLTAPYAGVPELLQRIRAAGLQAVVFSNKPDPDSKRVVKHYFPETDFAVIQGQVEHIPVKPDPAGALRIAEALGIAPESFLYLGDTGVDMQCACRAGMMPVGVLWGFRDREELIRDGAKILISRPEELDPYFQK